jgi:hypothetical protein
MARNQKLTGVIRGRTVTAVEGAGAAVRVLFQDGSIMTVRTPEAAQVRAPLLGRIRAVRQAGTNLRIDYEREGTLALTTAEPTGCVLLRARDGALEYAD